MTTRLATTWTCLALCLSACAGTPVAGTADDAVTFIVVRHAEKADDDPRDPSLSEAGQSRAQRLAARLREQRLAAAYATQYRRTQQTAMPVATAHGLDVSIHDAATSADDLAQALLGAHSEGNVLVVGHSNTVPGIVAALCDCTTDPMPEDEYDRISFVRIATDGRRNVRIERYAPDAATADAP